MSNLAITFIFILFLVEKSLATINCLLVCPQGQKNIENRFSAKDISRDNSMRGVRICCWF